MRKERGISPLKGFLENKTDSKGHGYRANPVTVEMAIGEVEGKERE